VKVKELIAFLQNFDPDAEVMINGDSGTPDPCSLPNHVEEIYTVENSDGEQEICIEGHIEDMRDEGYDKIISKAPLLWPS
tara:strand:+ start:644 stop:883 length:240 start_codon:yes stop_codon:yes gene_type:complete